jgi:hypothetical protein
MYLFKVSILPLSTIFLLCFGTVPTVWYFLVFNLLNKPWSCCFFFFKKTLCNEHILNFLFLNFVQILFHIPRCFITLHFRQKLLIIYSTVELMHFLKVITKNDYLKEYSYVDINICYQHCRNYF